MCEISRAITAARWMQRWSFLPSSFLEEGLDGFVGEGDSAADAVWVEPCSVGLGLAPSCPGGARSCSLEGRELDFAGEQLERVDNLCALLVS